MKKMNLKKMTVAVAAFMTYVPVMAEEVIINETTEGGRKRQHRHFSLKMTK